MQWLLVVIIEWLLIINEAKWQVTIELVASNDPNSILTETVIIRHPNYAMPGMKLQFVYIYAVVYNYQL